MRAVLAFVALLSGLGIAAAITPARADADDAAWIKKCVNDNKREGATPEVVAAYCSCMNGKIRRMRPCRLRLGKRRTPRKWPPATRSPAGNNAPVPASVGNRRIERTVSDTKATANIIAWPSREVRHPVPYALLCRDRP